MPTYVLLKGFPEYAAQNIADAQLLYTALLDPSTEANALTIGRITGRLPPLCIADTAVPLVIDSIDDAAGTRSSWVTNQNAALAFAIGDADPALSHRYASANVSTISSNTRIGNIALATANLISALGGSYGRPMRGISTQFTAHVRQTDTDGFTLTYATFPITVNPGVLEQGPVEDQYSTLAGYVTAAQDAAEEAQAAAALGIAPTLTFFGTATDEQAFGYFYAEGALEITGMQIAAQVAPTGAALTIDLVDGVGTEQSKIGTLAAGATYQRTVFATPLTLAAGDIVRGKIKSVGSTIAGGYLTVNLICNAT